MPTFNTTIDDNSPLITYSPAEAWHPGSAVTDQYAENYANGTFTLTGLEGATAKLKFYGTGIWLYGAKRPNHGMYSVTIDGNMSEQISGRRSDGIRDIDVFGNEFGAVLYRAFNLSLGTHEVVLTNEGSQGAALAATWLDLDYITWESDLGGNDGSLSTTTLDSSNFQTSGSGWGSAAANGGLGVTKGIYTNKPGDSLEINFDVRDAVEVYGSTGQSCGLFSVQIDNGVSSIYNATTSHNLTNQLIFFGANLGSGQHTLKMTNSELSNGSLVVDHAQAQVVQPGPSPSINPDNTSSSSRGPNTALIGGLCGALAFLMILLVVLFLWVRRRRRVAIVSRKTQSSRFEAFDIDQPSPPPSQATMRQTSLSDLLRSSMVRSRSHSDISGSSRRTGLSSESQPHSQKILNSVPSHEKLNKVDRSRRTRHVDRSGQTRDEHFTKSARSNKLTLDTLTGNTSNSRLPQKNITARGVSNNRLSGKPRSGHRSHKHRNKSTKKSKRPLPAVPRATSSNSRSTNVSRLTPLPTASGQPHRSTSMLKGRRRSVRNSRLVRAGYNLFFAQPGSSNSGSAYAPTTVLTSEISERPTTTLSPVTEAPPPLPPSRSLSPQPPRPLQIANRVDKVWDVT